MTKIDHRMIFLLVCCFMGVISVCDPHVLGDQNTFLARFVSSEFLNFMGVMVTITLASTANIHIELKRKEEENKEEIFPKTKAAVRKSAVSLLWSLLLSVILVVSKPLLPQVDSYMAFANSVALAILLWGILIIYDITKLAFRL